MKLSALTFNNKRRIYGVLFLLPWFIGFIFLFTLPMIQSLRYSLSRLDMSGETIAYEFIGFRNYVKAFTVDPDFTRNLVEAVGQMMINVPLILIFSLFAASLLNQKFRGRGIARAIFYLPVILASGVIMTIENESTMAAMMTGITYGTSGDGTDTAQTLLRSFELERMMVNAGVSPIIVGYLTGAVDRIYEIISNSGVQILIFLAGLQSISSSLYEAAKIEGATGYEIFWKITFPMVSPLILTNVIYTVIDSFTYNNLTTQIQDTAFKVFDFGLSAAFSWVYFLMISIILLIVAAIVSRRVFYYE